ncbi:endonuclease/exonuclease/phosphatase family protein [Fulvimarina sp. MAC3]|uniref:endonuclease/exonuclease/phosphatase family protein n=1 Tax=Fulvimarina sp. MAC3 TaxID=3148887 RepID=UPI0031FCC730
MTSNPSQPAENRSAGKLNTLVRFLASALTAAVFAALIAGYLGPYAHPFDSLSHFRAHLLVAALAGLAAMFVAGVRLARAIWLIALASVLVPLAVTAPFFGIRLAPSSDTARSEDHTALSLLQMNLRYNSDTKPALDLIRSTKADVVTLQESTERWVDALSGVKDIYPHRILCGVKKPLGGNVILSKFQIRESDTVCDEELGFLATTIDLANEEILTVASQHLVWPWPFRQWSQIEVLPAILAQLDHPLVIGGDFNAVPWSAAVSVYADAANARPIEGIGATFAPYALPASWKPVIGLPIDNVLVSSEIKILSTGTLPPTASDHLPVLTRFSIKP